MKKQLIKCEDGRMREARVHGDPNANGNYKIYKAGVRVKGKHVQGEAWHSLNSGNWYFLTDPTCRYCELLPRRKERPSESDKQLRRSQTVRDK